MYVPRFKLLWPELAVMNEVNRLQRQMDTMFSRNPLRRGMRQITGGPAVNMYESREAVIVEMEVPGCDPDKLDINVQGDVLTITGNRSERTFGERDVIHRQERLTGNFQRVIELPFKVTSEAVNATYKKGIVTLRLQRPEEEKPKSIKITVEK